MTSGDGAAGAAATAGVAGIAGVAVGWEGDRWTVEGSWYGLGGTVDAPVAVLRDAEDRRWAELRLLASLDSTSAADETFAIHGPAVDERAGAARLTWTLDGSTWSAKRLVLDATAETLTFVAEIEGTGELTTVSLLAGRVVQPRTSGLLMSGAWFESIVSGGPGDPGRIVTPASESASIGVVSGSEPGRGRWFFSPGPFLFAASRSTTPDPTVLPEGPWLSLGVDALPGEAAFTEVVYRAVDRGFAIDIDYDGHTPVDGPWRSPPLVIGEAGDPYTAIADQRARLASAREGSPSPPRQRPTPPDWWHEPIFCGWGAQCADAAADGLPMAAAASRATEANYDRWVDHLEARGVVPGTIVLDDKWQSTYGTNAPDPAKWPDLRGWIARRHARGQRVVLWYKAWDADGLPPEWCVRRTDGVPLGIDPTNPDAEAALRDSVGSMLGSAGLDADGLKIDFTARTPSGRATVRHGTAWGVDLLRTLLEILADEARRVKPDALLVGHTPNPIVAPAVGMLRLNDALRLDDARPDVDIVPQMRYRAAVARAACPDHPIDTDDWCVPNLAGWRAYTAIKAELGVPALYYATHIDRTLEPFEDEDYALLRRVWSSYREAAGLPPR